MSSLVLVWVWICAWLNCAGWLLSELHELNTAGYAAVIFPGLGLLWWWQRKNRVRLFHCFHGPILRQRFRRLFPSSFLILAALVFLGGALYAPSNYDALSYRIPRILHWQAAGQWHWIHTIFPRLNARACGIEWVSTPLILATKSDRLLFLLNFISFLFLPGLIYSVFTRLGIRRRVAWHWMWILPTGYCFLLQAGSLGNDIFGAPFVLAAMDYALRAKKSGSARDFFTAIVAAAMMSSAKTSDLPLLLPWGVAMLPSWRLLLRWPVRLAIVMIIAIFASFLPTAMFNIYYSHDWTGLKAEGVPVKSNPPLQLAGNIGLLAVQNLTPPIFPWAGNWNQAVPKLIPPALALRLRQTVLEPDAANFKVDRMQIEENAGLGFGLTLLLLCSLAAAIKTNGWKLGSGQFDSRESQWLTALRVLPWISLLALLLQSKVYSISRIVAPFYPLLIPVILVCPGQERLVTRRWWRWAAGVVFFLGFFLICISPARPLFPAETLLSAVHGNAAQSPTIKLTKETYQTYRQRNHAFAPVLAELPPNLKILGVFLYDDPETSLWQPFGSRQIKHVCPGDTSMYLKSEGIQYILLQPNDLQKWFPVSAEDWVRGIGGQIVAKIPLKIRISYGVEEWWLVKLS